ncbi:MAG: hypothetical protein KDA42_11640 [Planctomycetales bacterium]|nr:hypothetical protein [Planctomycetales bacterium]
MANISSHNVLNRLLTILARSFPNYLIYAHPSVTAGRQAVLDVLASVRDEQQLLCTRICNFLQQQGVVPTVGDFPLEYTDAHDLGIDYVLKLLVSYQQQDIAAIEECVEQLRLAPAALAFAEEALGLARGHLELIEEQLRQPA